MTPSLVPGDIVLGLTGHFAANVPEADQVRQRRELVEIMRRLHERPGVILADEVGMGKTFVAARRGDERRGSAIPSGRWW